MPQVEIVSPEAYAYDGECIAKAEELGKPGLVDIRPLPVTLCQCSTALRLLHACMCD